MILPANFVNEVRDEEATKVHFCPYCSRILFFEETEEAPEFIGDIESGSLADLADYAEEGEDEGDDDEEEQREQEDQEKDFPPARKPSARKAAAVREEYTEDSED